MADLSESSGFSWYLAFTTTKETGVLSREDGCKLTRPLFILLIICVFGTVAVGQPWDGNGVEGDPYQIWTAADMQAIGADANFWGAHFKLMADIDIGAYTGTSFNMIGVGWDDSFFGVFDGDGHTISNFSYTSTGTNNIGLFRAVSGPHDSSAIKNLGLIDPNVNGGTGKRVGALIGRFNARISNCYVQGGTVLGSRYVGGLAGQGGGVVSNCYTVTSVTGTGIETATDVGGLVGLNSAELKNCYSNCVVEGEAHVGGLVGGNMSEIRNCYATGIVTGHNSATGGLVGEHGGINAGMYNCYSTAVVDGNSFVGGLVGENYKTITNCYAAGSVQGSRWVGGLVGTLGGGNCTKSFWDNTVNPDLNGVGDGSDPDVIGESTVNMQSESTFTSVGWDFVVETINGTEDIWNICEGVDYPKLTWQFVIGDFDGDDDVDLADFAMFAAHWLETDSSFWCGGTDLTNDGQVGLDDLREFTDNWLAGM